MHLVARLHHSKSLVRCTFISQLKVAVRSLCSGSRNWKQPDGYDSGVKVRNSLCHEDKDTLVPLILPHGKVARWYACGPTVYDTSHIGHASYCVRFDIIRRILENFFDIKVIQVMGITNIDDKIIEQAAKTGEDHSTLANRHEAQFLSDMNDLQVLPASHYARVTDYVPSIIQFISRVIRNGYAYATPSGSVYFDLMAFGADRYGKLRYQRLEEEGPQEIQNTEKRHPRDFALWKAAKKGEPWWLSPWGRGRPGWHMECSAMSSAIFGENLDIHVGGIDLAFPHHTNEIAQCEGCFETNQWTNYFLHSGFLYLKRDSEKMSKSLGNVISIPQFLSSYSSNHFRTLCLFMRYSSNIEYSDEALSKAVTTCRQITSFLGDCEAYVRGQITGGAVEEAKIFESVNDASMRIRQAFADDFDTPRAMTVIMDLIRSTNVQLQPSKKASCCSARCPGAISYVSSFISSTLSSLGFDFKGREASDSVSAAKLSSTLDTLVSFRSDVRNWAFSTDNDFSDKKGETTKEKKKRLQEERADLLTACDKVRDSLTKQGIQLKDRGQISTWEFTDVRPE